MDNALTKAGVEPRAIVERLRSVAGEHARSRADRVRARVGGHWIGLRSVARDRVFAEVRPSRTKVEVFLLPAPRDLRDPHGLAKKVPPSRGWGWFRSRLVIASVADADRASALVRQSYDTLQGRADGGRSARRRARRRETS